jgi:glycosyltransferase involved in cell wall biosynthesis
MRGWFGIASLESLCHGKPVIAGLDEWNIECIKAFTGADKLPWIIARNQEELEDKLPDLIEDSNLRDHTGRSSRLFMEKQWNEQRVLDLLFKIYEGL